MSTQSQTAWLGGFGLHYELDDFTDPWTTAPVVLLQHGFCRSARSWYAWVPTLARSYRVLRPDARGCGASSRPGADFWPSLSAFAGDLLRLLDVLQIDRVHYVGESYGGVLGLSLAGEHPDRIASLVLCSTPPRLSEQQIGVDYALGFADTSAAIDALGVREWARRTMAYRLDQRHASPELTAWCVEDMGRADATLCKRWLASLPGLDMRERLGLVRVPALVISGAESPATSRHAQEEMRDALADARLMLFEGVGHGISQLQPERCAEAALGFFREVDARPAR